MFCTYSQNNMINIYSGILKQDDRYKYLGQELTLNLRSLRLQKVSIG